MSKFLYTQYSFANGELNPRLLGRTDIKEYFQAGKQVNRFLIADEGSLNESPGLNSLYYLGDQSFNHTYSSKIIIDRDPLNRGASFYTVGIKKDGQIAGSTGSVNYNDILQIFTNGTVPTSISSSSQVRGDTTELFEYGTHIQLNDTVLITDKNGNYEPIVIYVNSVVSNTWSVSAFSDWAAYINDDTYSFDEGRARSQFLGSLNTNPLDTLTVAGAQITANFAFFSVDMVGSCIEVFGGITSYLVRITNYVNPFQVDFANVVNALGAGAHPYFKLPEFYNGNYPKVVSVFEQRLMFANTTTNEGEIWASQTGNLGIFLLLEDETFIDDSPFSFTPFSVDTSPIYWLLTERYLTAGTQTEEFIVNKVDGVFGRDNISIVSTSKYGSHDVGLAFRAQSASYFVERGGKFLRELSFSEENGGYTSRNIGVLGPELEGIYRVVYDYSRKRMYVSSESGLYACTVDSSSSVLGWAKLPYNAEALGVSKDNEVILMVDDLYTAELLEYTETADTKEFFIDDPLGSRFAQTDWSNLVGEEKHQGNTAETIGAGSIVTFLMRVPAEYGKILGETIQVVLEDSTVVDAVIKDGFPALGGLYVDSVSLGISYIQKPREFDSILETTPIQQGSQIGDAQIAFQRVDKVGLRLFKALGNVMVGTTETSLEETEYTTEFTGVHEVHVDGSPELDHTIIVKNTSDRPISLLGISSKGSGEEG